MKTLAACAFLIALAVPALAQPNTTELKKKYKNNQRPQEEPQAVPEGQLRSSSVLADGAPAGLPKMAPRAAVAAGVDELKTMTDNMRATRNNLDALINYVHPYQKGAVAPTGKDAEEAQLLMAQESAAAGGLIADANAALAKGIPRDPLDPDAGKYGKFRLHMGYAMRAMYAYRNPTAAQRLEALASAQVNVLGQQVSLIVLKRLNPPETKDETDAEAWLASALQSLETAKKAGR